MQIMFLVTVFFSSIFKLNTITKAFIICSWGNFFLLDWNILLSLISISRKPFGFFNFAWSMYPLDSKYQRTIQTQVFKEHFMQSIHEKIIFTCWWQKVYYFGNKSLK